MFSSYFLLLAYLVTPLVVYSLDLRLAAPAVPRPSYRETLASLPASASTALKLANVLASQPSAADNKPRPDIVRGSEEDRGLAYKNERKLSRKDVDVATGDPSDIFEPEAIEPGTPLNELVEDGSFEDLTGLAPEAQTAAEAAIAAGELPGMAGIEGVAEGSVPWAAIGSNFAEGIEVPEELLEGMMIFETSAGEIVDAAGTVVPIYSAAEAAAMAGELSSAASSVEASIVAAGGASEAGSLITTEGGLIVAGAATLGPALGLAAVVMAAGLMVVPLIDMAKSLKDHLKTTTLKGIVFDIDGDGKPEQVKDYMSKMDPNNTLLYHKRAHMQAFMDHVFKKKEKQEFTIVDPVLGDIHFKWKGDVTSDQAGMIPIITNMTLSPIEKTKKLVQLFEAPNKSGGKLHQTPETSYDIDHDGKDEHFKFKYKGNGKGKGEAKLVGDVDGDGGKEKCKWHGHDEYECHDTTTDSDEE